MDIQSIKELGIIINGLGAQGKEAFIYWLILDFCKVLLSCGVIAFIFYMIYNLVKMSILNTESERIIARASGFTTPIITSEAISIAEWIKKGKEAK